MCPQDPSRQPKTPKSPPGSKRYKLNAGSKRYKPSAGSKRYKLYANSKRYKMDAGSKQYKLNAASKRYTTGASSENYRAKKKGPKGTQDGPGAAQAVRWLDLVRAELAEHAPAPPPAAGCASHSTGPQVPPGRSPSFIHHSSQWCHAWRKLETRPKMKAMAQSPPKMAKLTSGEGSP